MYHEINVNTEDIEFKADNALLLRHMSTFFGIAELFRMANDFIAGSINKDTIVPYLLKSFELNDDIMQSE